MCCQDSLVVWERCSYVCVMRCWTQHAAHSYGPLLPFLELQLGHSNPTHYTSLHHTDTNPNRIHNPGPHALPHALRLNPYTLLYALCLDHSDPTHCIEHSVV